jgi:hypothetical protein
MIQNEVITSHKKNVDIDWRWQDLEEKEDCEELAQVRGEAHNRLGHRPVEGGVRTDHRLEGGPDQALPRAAED